MNILYYDLETSGLDYSKHAIHEISGIVEVDGHIEERFTLYCNPNYGEIDKKALEVSNKTLDIVSWYPEINETYRELHRILSTYGKFTLCGYNNSSFDDKFLRRFLELNSAKYTNYFYINSLDTMTLATAALLNERDYLINFKLSTVCEYIGIELDNDRLHTSEYDTELIYSLWKHIHCNISKE